MLYSAPTYTLRNGYDVKTAVKMIIDAGFPAVDISLLNSREDISYLLDDGYLDTAKELLDIAKSHGAIFNQAHAPFFGNRDGTYVDMIKELLPRCMKFCSTLGIPIIVVHPTHPRYFGHEKEMFDENIKLYRALAPYAKEYGVKIALENMWRYERVTNKIIDSVYSSPIELCNAYDTLDDPEAFTVCFDIGHSALTGREPEDAIRTIGHDRLGALHVHDVDYAADTHTLPGIINKIRWNEVCRALGEIDYTGDLTLEAVCFLDGFDKSLHPEALRFMNSVAKHLADKVDSYRVKK